MHGRQSCVSYFSTCIWDRTLSRHCTTIKYNGLCSHLIIKNAKLLESLKKKIKIIWRVNYLYWNQNISFSRNKFDFGISFLKIHIEIETVHAMNNNIQWQHWSNSLHLINGIQIEWWSQKNGIRFLFLRSFGIEVNRSILFCAGIRKMCSMRIRLLHWFINHCW